MIYGNITFTFEQEFLSVLADRRLRIISLRGTSERNWEAGRDTWYGDMDRDRSGSVRKRGRTEMEGEPQVEQQGQH